MAAVHGSAYYYVAIELNCLLPEFDCCKKSTERRVGTIQVCFTLEPLYERIALNMQYNHLVQGLIYNLLGQDLASFIHNEGFEIGKRKFRMFTFSRLMGKFQLNKDNGTIEFSENMQLYVASPFEAICKQLTQTVLNQEILNLGNQQVRLVSLAVEKAKVKNNKIKIKTLSPVTVYSTMQKPDGRPYTVYFHPKEEDFQELIFGNLIKKFEIVHGCAYLGQHFSIKPQGQVRQNIIMYKGGVIKGYSGIFHVTGAPELLQVGLDAGFGSKGAQGFGLCQLVE